MLKDYKGPANDLNLLASLVGDTVQGFYFEGAALHLVFEGGATLQIMGFAEAPPSFAKKASSDVWRDFMAMKERLLRHKQEMAFIEKMLKRLPPHKVQP